MRLNPACVPTDRLWLHSPGTPLSARLALSLLLLVCVGCGEVALVSDAPGETEDSAILDGSTDAPAPDASTSCIDNTDCVATTNLCLINGVCDKDTKLCVFETRDCSGLDNECTQGVCVTTTGNCAPTPINQDQACGAGTQCDGFGACELQDSQFCTEAGTESRTCRDFTCQSGTCSVGTDYTDSQACAIDKTGLECAATTQTGCTACGGFADTCDEAGTQNCTCTSFACDGGACIAAPSSCVVVCSRSTSGLSCGTSVTSCGICSQNAGFPNDCSDLSGSRNCTCRAQTCSSGTCATTGSPSSCVRACTPSDVSCDVKSCFINGQFGLETLCCSGSNCNSVCSPCS